MDNTNEYITTDLGLASFLIAKNFEIIKLKNSSKRKSFVFSDSPQLKKLIEVFNFGKKDIPEVMIDARELFRSYRELKVKLFNIV